MPDSRTSRARLAALALGAAGLLAAGAALAPLGSAASASPASTQVDARPWVSGDHTIPYFDKTQTISEVVDVETGMDSDRDGKVDTIRVNIDRPDAKGKKVPLIIHASPYFFGGARSAWEPGFFVPHGYAVATVALPGTDFSTGCADVGGYREVLGTKAIIDWANGRAKGHYLDGSNADATKWTNGKTGMIGVSWDGTIANSVAATGVEGLETIVPVAAISSWYDYTRGNGIPFFEGHVKYLNDFVSNYDSQHCVDMTPRLQTKSDDPTGNYNPWWSVRDYRIDASKIKASVFVVAGLNDENVKTIQFGKWWDQLEKYDVTRRIFLHQGQHVEPFFSYGANYSTPLLQWFDYYLQGLDNGEPDEPRAIIQREDMSWSTDKEWPPTGTEDRTMFLSDPLGRSAGALTDDVSPTKSKRYVTFTQAVAQSDDSVVQSPTTPRGDRAVFLSDKLSSEIRESGTATVTLRVKVDKPTAGFQARVVDYNGSTGFIVSRTEADLGHYKSLNEDVLLKPGKYYTLTWEINTDDRIFAKGHNLGLVITAEQSNPTEGYVPVKATIDTKMSSLTMPLSGAAKSLQTAGPLAPIVGKVVGPAGPTKNLSDFVREFFMGSNS
jgi:X-Pro dipeptidyl-peptidase